MNQLRERALAKEADIIEAQRDIGAAVAAANAAIVEDNRQLREENTELQGQCLELQVQNTELTARIQNLLQVINALSTTGTAGEEQPAIDAPVSKPTDQSSEKED